VLNTLTPCSSGYYILVSQPGVHATDYESKRSAPLLRASVLRRNDYVESSFTVSEVVGEVDLSGLQTTLKSKCAAADVLELDGAGMYPGGQWKPKRERDG
jgi:hypothetical protein